MAITPKTAEASVFASKTQFNPSSFRSNGVMLDPTVSALGIFVKLQDMPVKPAKTGTSTAQNRRVQPAIFLSHSCSLSREAYAN